MPRMPTRKRPCRICRCWFLPNPRLRSRQKACGDFSCRKEWHRKKCAEWNRRNPDYFRANYLQKKLEAAKTSKPPTVKSRMKTSLPLEYVQEVIGIQQLIIIEYLAQLIQQRFAKTIIQSFPVNTPQAGRLPAMVFSRGDPSLVPCNH